MSNCISSFKSSSSPAKEHDRRHCSNPQVHVWFLRQVSILLDSVSQLSSHGSVSSSMLGSDSWVRSKLFVHSFPCHNFLMFSFLFFFLNFYWIQLWIFFEKESPCVAQTGLALLCSLGGLELMILLPQPPRCWHCGCEPPHLTCSEAMMLLLLP